MKIRWRPKPLNELVMLATTRAFAVIGVATVFQQLLDPVPVVEDFMKANWGLLLLGVAIMAAAAGTVRLFQPRHVTFRARGTQLEVEIKTGNLFDEPANIALQVNDFFDTELGKPVAPETVHGQFISRVFLNNAGAARAAVDSALAGKSPIETIARAQGAPRRFKIGETATIAKGGHHYVLVALARTDAGSCEARSTPSQLVTAFVELWEAVRACCNHQPISVPLMGAGPSRTGFDKIALLDFILATAIRAQQVAPVTKKLTVVLRDDDLSEIDMFDVKRRYG